MNANSSIFREAIARFDALNKEDPNEVIIGDKKHPKELIYARHMTDRLLSFAPGASEALQLAARCQHIQRWKIPRSDFPMDKMGYKKWRNTLMGFHAETAAEILQEVGYDDETIENVKALVKKKGLKKNPDAQTLEDVVCLVFLEHYAMDFAQKHEDEKVVDILKKTWRKMSPAGHQAALSLPLADSLMQLVAKATAETSS